jgi:hypothetical protein
MEERYVQLGFRKQDFAQIIELYDVSDNRTKRARSNHNLEVDLFQLFDDIKIQE